MVPRIQIPTGPDIFYKMAIKNVKIKRKNTFLSVVVDQPAECKAVVVLAHGFAFDKGGPSGIFPLLAKDLSKNNFCAMRFDFANFGKAKGFNIFDSIDDLVAVIAYAKQFSSNVFLVGHSLGGLVSLVVAAKDPQVKAVVLWSPPPALHLPKRFRGFIKRYTLSPVQVGIELVYYLFARQRLRAEAHFKRLRIPILFVYGTNDQFSDYINIERLRKYKNVELMKIEGLDHYYAAFKKEMVERTGVWVEQTYNRLEQ